jgi:selenocysteine lyase/cysteine desulfurase
MPTTDRRHFLGSVMWGAAGIATLPRTLGAEGSPDTPGRFVPPTSIAPEDERYWQVVRRQFPLAPGVILMNAANLCPSSFAVQETVFRLTRDMDGDASSQNRAKLSPLREESRRAVAEYIGADATEVALTRNTSESNNTVVAGLDLKPGDEVVLWDQNHQTNSTSWDVRARRLGFTVRRVTTPPAPTTPAALLQAFADAFTPRTRVLAFSHVSNSSGVALPARELCALARERGVFAHVDGAQTFGALHVDVHAMGCDTYTGSAHKWLTGPKEVGVLYVRAERIPELWAADVGVGYDDSGRSGARKFESLGQRDDAAVAAVAVAVELHRSIGVDVVEQRVRQLAAAIRERVSTRLPGTRFHSPEDPATGSGVVVFAPPGLDTRQALARLYEEHKVGCATTGGATAGLRLSAHIYNTLDEVDRVVDALAAMPRG